MSDGTAHGPASEESGREDEGDKEQAGKPGEFAWGEFNFEEVEWQGEEQGDHQGEPERDGGALEEAPDGERVEQCGEAIFHGKAGLEKGQVEDDDQEEKPAQKREDGAALVGSELGGEDQDGHGRGQPEDGAGKGPSAEPEVVGKPEVLEVGQHSVARAGVFTRGAEPAEETEGCRPEEMAESSSAQTGPDDVDQRDYGNHSGGHAPVLGLGAPGCYEFGVLSEAGDEPHGKSDQPRADNEASSGGGFADADEAGAEPAGLGDTATGVDEVSEAEKIQDGQRG